MSIDHTSENLLELFHTAPVPIHLAGPAGDILAEPIQLGGRLAALVLAAPVQERRPVGIGGTGIAWS